MPERIEIGSVDHVPPGHSARFEIDDTIIAVFNAGGTFFALADTCSHAKASLAEGDLDEKLRTIECPLHGSAFSLETGAVLSLPATDPVRCYPVTVENSMIVVEYSPEENA